ncbi:MAG TPA: hypothetical protein VHU42_08645 [Rhodopila sp.]|nr:hypothetical protein [Rhodopila sp.]
MRYPLASWSLAAPLLAYAALLWWRPVAFLLVLPCVLPAWDLGLWTGWMMVGESDFFVLTTIAVLLIRAPPALSDLVPRGLPGAVLLVFVASWSIATIAGLASPLGAPPSDNAFLRPDNALRLAKGLAEALALLPFFRQRERSHGDAVAWFGWGMALGIAAVTVIVLAERALFTSILDFTGDYRVSGPFSSMRVGGGHIGAYYSLALPMALCLVRLRSRWLGAGLLLLTYLLGGYGLAVTFARTAYAAGAIGAGVAGVGWLCASRPAGGRATWGIVTLCAVPLLLVMAALALAASDTGMRNRFAASAADLVTRESNWQAGLAVRDSGMLADLFGMGLGTYQRAMLMRSPVNRPSDIVVRQDGEGPYVSMRVETPFFLGQKITVPAAGTLHFTVRARSADDGATLNALLCDKVLLYSDNCRGIGIPLKSKDTWQTAAIDLPVAGLGRGWGWFHRLVELSVFGSPAGHHIDLRDVRLVDDAGQTAVANGGFTHGLDRWIFTDDNHVSWRMLNEYLMLWFETGGVGVLAFLALSGAAMAGGMRAAGQGAVTGAAVAGSVASFLISGLFDNVLEAPRLATLFFLVCLCGQMLWDRRSATND